MLRQRQPRTENEPHRRYVASLGCLLCGGEAQCAHVRYADLSVGKPYTGKQEKPDDKYTVPLCPSHHTSQHAAGSESVWWAKHRIDPVKIGLALFAVTGDSARGEAIVSACREQRAA